MAVQKLFVRLPDMMKSCYYYITPTTSTETLSKHWLNSYIYDVVILCFWYNCDTWWTSMNIEVNTNERKLTMSIGSMVTNNNILHGLQSHWILIVYTKTLLTSSKGHLRTLVYPSFHCSVVHAIQKTLQDLIDWPCSLNRRHGYLVGFLSHSFSFVRTKSVI